MRSLEAAAGVPGAANADAVMPLCRNAAIRRPARVRGALQRSQIFTSPLLAAFTR
jgi:hypothetical protein